MPTDAQTGDRHALAEDADRGPEPDASAWDAVRAYLADQVEALRSWEPQVRLDGYDAVHRSRVATRRLRSTLRSYESIFRGRRGLRLLRSEVRWHAGLLGAPRDAEVQRERLLRASTVLGGPEADQLRALVADRLGATHELAHRALVESLQTERYERLRTDLAALIADPALRESAAESAVAVLPPMLQAVTDKVARLTAQAESHPAELAGWHEVRKAAKAARYGAELLVPVWGATGRERVAVWRAVTEPLGQMQDAVVCQQVIVELSASVAVGHPARHILEDLRTEQAQLLSDALGQGRERLATALEVSALR